MSAFTPRLKEGVALCIDLAAAVLGERRAEQAPMVGERFRIALERTIAAALHSLAWTRLDAGNYREAREAFERSLQLRPGLGDKRNVANSLCYLGSVALLEDSHDEATALLDESVALARELGNVLVLAAALANHSLVALLAGDADRADALCRESLALAHEVGDKRTTVECLHALAGVAALRRDLTRAGVFWGAAEMLHAEIGAPPRPPSVRSATATCRNRGRPRSGPISTAPSSAVATWRTTTWSRSP